VFIALFLLTFCSALFLPQAVSQELYPGLRYEHLTLPTQSIHILEVDPAGLKIVLGVPDKLATRARTTSSIAQHHHALAAVNGSFFDYGSLHTVERLATKFFDYIGYPHYYAFPSWTVKSANRYYATSQTNTGAVAWHSDLQVPCFTTLSTSVSVTLNGKIYTVMRYNRPACEGPVLYSFDYDVMTPIFHKRVTEITIRDLRIVSIRRNSYGNSPIPPGGYVYVVPASRASLYRVVVGDPANVTITSSTPSTTRISDDPFSKFDTLLASTPLLIQEGHVIDALKERTSNFYTKRHPRTAVGVLGNGHWIFVVVDGARGQALGFTILELADFMQVLGCTDALNLDGGGSSTMVLDGKVVNQPSHGFRNFAECHVSNVLMILPFQPKPAI
jgi:hypothetical protein